ncbi:DUF624 domain-containing protein [Microbacterium sp. KUDC0406]|uniref:DUF624 domain-containing protein n=1 Tax=Microbacterium sp. KUDC0406 TaxID=2909588 RepID=UPI001F34C44D|nr:DUF624 domain-containing protein [Microbacterium sp. KUDC0406]UJP10087.1 DUF624 domain-containing protein [Microbacterium sp. KUDC0406]
MRRVAHDTWASILGVLYLGLMVNLLVLIAALPLVVLLMTTDPVHSWPLMAAAAPLAAPALTAAFGAFRAHDEGETHVVRAFWRAWRATVRPALLIGAIVVAVAVVLLVDVRMLADTDAAVVVVPLLLLLVALAAISGLLGLAAVAEVPDARLRDVLRASVVLGVRRWYLQLLSFAVLGVQFGVFTTMPAIAIGITAAPALYVVWANSRHCLRPVLDLDEEPATVPAR